MISALLLAVSIWWSVFHPTDPDVEYMRTVVQKAQEYGNVAGFEACGDCAGALNGMNGLLLWEPYPETAKACDRAKALAQRKRMKEICDLAHSIGKPFIYWHRELYLPKEMLKDEPKLLDENGDFDLLGEPYAKYLRWKIDETFKVLPELDGLVLTMTEADYSVIHAANAKRYPPAKVVETIVRIFAEELEKRGKIFSVRSFGSIAADYESILAGSALAAKDHGFEIETKVTPYDFDPFLPDNPFLRHVPGTTLAAECDGLGEFLGAGYLPCVQTDAIRRYVTEATRKKVDRFTIRIDRVGNRIFDSAQEANLYAYHRFIADPSLTSDEVMSDWAKRRWPKCATEMRELAKDGFRLVRATQFVAENVAFHQNPVTPNFKYVKAGGIFAAFRENADLHMSGLQWGMQFTRRTPGHKAILAEKDEAVKLADEGFAKLEALKGRLDPSEYARHRRAWSIATKATRTIRAFTRCGVAYFEDMAEGRDDPKRLVAAIAGADREIRPLMTVKTLDLSGFDFSHARATGENLDRVYFVPFLWLSHEFLNEYRAERAMRKAMDARSDVVDYVVAGGIYDDNRVERAMHASYQGIRPDGKVVRFVGNPVFPNGTIAVEFRDVPGATVEVDVEPADAAFYTKTESVTNGIRRVTIAKKGQRYPAVRTIALTRKDGRP